METPIAEFHELAKVVSDVVKRESDEIEKQTAEIQQQIQNR